MSTLKRWNSTLNSGSGGWEYISGIPAILTESSITFSDITTGDASTTEHGFLPKLAGGTTTFLRADGTWAAAGVLSVSGTAPIVSSGGATPAISISAATTSAAGSMSSADKTKLDGVSGTNTGDQLVFKTISVSGQSDVVADTTTDTLTLVAGTNVTITTNAATDTITIASSGGSSGASLTQGTLAGRGAASGSGVYEGITLGTNLSMSGTILNATGATGPQGIQGIQGVKGDTGATGAQGIQGATGATGATGAQGTAGATGPTGPAGTVPTTLAAKIIQGSTEVTDSTMATSGVPAPTYANGNIYTCSQSGAVTGFTWPSGVAGQTLTMVFLITSNGSGWSWGSATDMTSGGYAHPATGKRSLVVATNINNTGWLITQTWKES